MEGRPRGRPFVLSRILMAMNKEQQLLLARLDERVQELRGYL